MSTEYSVNGTGKENNNGNSPSVVTPAGSAGSASKSDVPITGSESSVYTPAGSAENTGKSVTPNTGSGPSAAILAGSAGGIGWSTFDPSATAVWNGAGVNNNNDPNEVKVNIRDKETPIVLLYGPPACGKTMILVRLSRYLREKGYTVDPEKSFRDSSDSNYQSLCSHPLERRQQ